MISAFRRASRKSLHRAPTVLSALIIPAGLFFSTSLIAGGLFSKKKPLPTRGGNVEPAKKTGNPSFIQRVNPSRRAILSVSPPPTRPIPAPSFSGPLTPVTRRDPDQIRVFVLGDSQLLTSFGPEFQKKLAAGGFEVLMHGVKNGTPYFWEGKWPSPVLTSVFDPASVPGEGGNSREFAMHPRAIREYVEVFDPDIFVFQAGTNFEVDLAGQNDIAVGEMIAEALETAGMNGAAVLWIGPPDARDDVRSVDLQDRAEFTLRTVLCGVTERQGYDCFFASRPVCLIPNGSSGDGEHHTHERGIEWATVAAKWVQHSIESMNCDDMLRPVGGSGSPMTRLFSEQMDDERTLEQAINMQLRLLAKSDPGDIGTLPYTDAFSVFQYELENADAIGPDLARRGLQVNAASGKSIIYVLHWSVHNDGAGPRPTRITSREIGQSYMMPLYPLASHPLEKALGTMVQFNDFNDFDAPVYIAANFVEESSR